ncbi:MAG: hypothetical protein JXK05_06320 [Campylobacterales bacterium]|nr:hypothetical protein [Campylobacterales bacterium]
MNVRLVPAPIAVAFETLGEDSEHFEREYHQLSEADDDPIGQWLKLAKARGDAAQSDPILLNLLVELHRKIDKLEQLIKNEKPARLELAERQMIERIGFGYFEIKNAPLRPGASYYGRIEMPVHPKHDVGIFFEATTPSLAKITRMHERDEKEWGAYLTARERVMIREMRGTE